MSQADSIRGHPNLEGGTSQREDPSSVPEPGHGSWLAHSIRGMTQRVGATRIGVLAIGWVVSPLQRQLYRRSHGRLSLTGRAPVLLLTTVGRHTGKLRTVPVFFLRDGDRLVICNVNPGFEGPNPWTLNLRANPAARVEIRGSTSHVHGRAATEDEVTRYWPLFIDLWPAYQTFFDRGGTRTVFVLEPDRTLKREKKTMGSYRSLLERYTELSNAGDLDGIMDLYAEDAVQVMPDGTFEGRSAIRERLAQDMSAFPDMHFGFVSFIEQGDAFADEFVAVGTHAGSLVLPDGTELPPTGKRVEMKGMELVRVRDGKIVVDNLYYDNLAVAAQLGLLPQAVPTTAS